MKTTPTNSQTEIGNETASRVVFQIKMTVLLVIIFLVAALKGSCADSTHVISSKNTFFVAIAGKGNSRSINFERVFSQGSKVNFSYSVGAGYANKNFSVPVSISAITTGKAHHIEANIAVIPSVVKHEYAKSGKVDSDKQMYIKPSIGYRYQRANGGFFFKAALGPQLFLDPPSYNLFDCSAKVLKVSGQVAVGFSF